MPDADPAPAALPEANPDLASDAELAARAAALVAALRNGNSDAQMKAAKKVGLLVAVIESTKPQQPANPRAVAALSAAGVGAALLLVMSSANTGVEAVFALRRLMSVSDAERRAVCTNLGVDKLLQLLEDSQDKLRRNALANMLLEFTYCSEWMESLSPESSDLVSRIFSLPFLSTANAWVTDRALAAAQKLLDQHPSFRRAWVPAGTSRLVEFLKLPGSQEHPGRQEQKVLTRTACRLLRILQQEDAFDVLAFEKARVHVACAELLGQLCRYGPSCCGKFCVGPARVLSTSFTKSPALRGRIHNLIFACPGALSGVIAGIGYACSQSGSDADALVEFFDRLRRLTPFSAESFVVDAQFAAFAILSQDDKADHPAYTQLLRSFVLAWKAPDCLRAMAQPLEHQKLAVAVSLASLTDDGSEFKRLLAADDHIDVLAQALVESAASPRVDKDIAGDFGAWQEEALRQSIGWLGDHIGLDDAAAHGTETVADGPAPKRARTFGGTKLRASDVNVQRRDSTILLVAGRPFYVVGPLIEASSAVLADALSSAATLDPVTVALPNQVPEEQQYALFHAAVEHAYTGAVASDVAAESLLPLWCLGDHLQMNELCAWCEQRLVPVLANDAALLERAWTAALSRPSDALGDACATAWLLLEAPLGLDDITAILLLKRVSESCAAKELVAAQLARVLRKALLASFGGNAALDDEDDDDDEEEEEDEEED